MAVTFKEIDIVSSLFCRLSFSIRECQRGARFGIPCVFLFRVSDFIWFSHPYPRGKGESGTDRNSVFEAHGGRGWRALVWVHTGRRGPGEAVRFEVVLGYKWTQMADELPVFLGKISLARGTRKLAPLGAPLLPPSSRSVSTVSAISRRGGRWRYHCVCRASGGLHLAELELRTPNTSPVALLQTLAAATLLSVPSIRLY